MAFLDLMTLKFYQAHQRDLLRSEMMMLSTRPIKGTKARDKDPQQDKKNAEALKKSIKDQSENLNDSRSFKK